MTPEEFVSFAAMFVATSSTTLLQITDQSANGGFGFDTMVDNFSVVVVPEPGTLVLLATGLFGLGLSLRREPRDR